MENFNSITERKFGLLAEQLRLLHRVGHTWALKNEPDIPCFDIDMECDGSYGLTFMNDKLEAISDTYLLLVDDNLDLLLPECQCKISYNPKTGELLSGDLAYIPVKCIPETAEQWLEELADNPEEKETLEYNRRIVLMWICSEWIPERKDNVPNILISRSIPSEFELRFLKEGKSIVPEAFVIEQDYEAFYFRLDSICINIKYFPSVDQLLVGGTYYSRAAVQQQEI